MLPESAAVAYEQQIAGQAQAIAEKLANSETKTLAVVDFTDLQGNVTELGRFLAEELSIGLAGLGQGFEVVHRTHLKALLEEHKLSATGLIDPTTARELGRIAGVDALITGTVTPLGDSVRLAVKVLGTESAHIVTSSTTNIPKTQAIETLLQREIVRKWTGPEQPPGPRDPRTAASTTAGGFLFQLKGCTLSGEMLTCSLTVTNEQKDCRLTISARQYFGDRSRMIDEHGNQIEAAELAFGSHSTTGWIEEDTVTGVPASILLKFQPLSPEVSKLALLEVGAKASSACNGDSVRSLRVQFRDIPIHREQRTLFRSARFRGRPESARRVETARSALIIASLAILFTVQGSRWRSDRV